MIQLRRGYRDIHARDKKKAVHHRAYVLRVETTICSY